MKLKHIVRYLTSLIDENNALILEFERSKKIWMIINFLLRYPALVFVGIVGFISSLQIKNPSPGGDIAVLVFTAFIGFLNVSHSFLKPDVAVEISNSTIDGIRGLINELRITIDELSAECLENPKEELSREFINRYLLIITKFNLNKSNIMKNKPNSFFVRSNKIPTAIPDQPAKILRKESAFDFERTATAEDYTPREVGNNVTFRNSDEVIIIEEDV